MKIEFSDFGVIYKVIDIIKIYKKVYYDKINKSKYSKDIHILKLKTSNMKIL